MNENIKRLEEKIAYLERHVTEQDRAMLELAEDIARLRRELKSLRAVRGEATSGGGATDVAAEPERPPHY